jgi:hypothetical protein
MKRTLYVSVVIIIVILASVSLFFNTHRDYYKTTLNYEYITNDDMNGTKINYTEYWSYQLLGIHNDTMRIIAYKTLRSYIITVKVPSGLVIGAYYQSAPHYNITFGSSFYYEPIVLFRHYQVGQTVMLLNNKPFKVISVSGGREVLAYYNQTESEIEHYVFTYSDSSGYLLNGTTFYEYRNDNTEIVLYNQNILLS